ncbi:abl interactor 1-like [Brevipalpus obovatus]|uniref:abl interactor 1-like n=1 Tax=Brevipalpus obovatus TaxID=246614 RepID=UPI003D9F6363
MSDLYELIQNDIPEGKEKLRASRSNLELVAKYCEDNYAKTSDKHAALEVTKNYTTQSLAHVAYQINALAYSLVHMLDLQETQLAEMESQINHINQTVNIHKEKVARREIGAITTGKSSYRLLKLIIPANPERPGKYTRTAIDYSLLDDIGHGVKIPDTNTMKAKRMSSQDPMNGSVTLRSNHSAPNCKPPTPPGTLRGTSTLSRMSKEYRTPAPPVAPPQVPSNYAPNYPMGHPKGIDSRRGSGYATLPGNMAHGGHHIAQAMQSMQLSDLKPGQYPQSSNYGEMNKPDAMDHYQHYQHYGLSSNQIAMDSNRSNMNERPTVIVPPTPPPLPLPPLNIDGMDHMANAGSYESGSVTPPLPPPPPDMMNRSEDNDWIPKNYIEKVIAIYDYVATREDELSFSENSVIYVIKKNEDDWFEGVMDGVTGLFPGNFVEPCL